MIRDLALWQRDGEGRLIQTRQTDTEKAELRGTKYKRVRKQIWGK